MFRVFRPSPPDLRWFARPGAFAAHSAVAPPPCARVFHQCTIWPLFSPDKVQSASAGDTPRGADKAAAGPLAVYPPQTPYLLEMPGQTATPGHDAYGRVAQRQLRSTP